MDIQMPVRKPFATDYISATEENGALGNIFTELYETLGFLERNYQPSNCTEQIKNFLTGSPLVSLPKTMEFSFYDQAQHEVSIEQQPTCFESAINTSKNNWVPMDVSSDMTNGQYNNIEPLYVRKTDRVSYDHQKKNNECQSNVALSAIKSNEVSLVPRKRKMDFVGNENKVQIMCDIGDAALQTENASRILQEQFKNNTKFVNQPRTVWPAEELSLTDDELDNSYNISDALLTLTNLTSLKQESTSPGVTKIGSPSTANDTSSRHKENRDSNDENICFQELLHGQKSHDLNAGKPVDHLREVAENQEINPPKEAEAKDCRFQYVLGAATSIATKMNEESLTYLNQRQPYEIKLKKLGDLSPYKGKLLKTIIRICFHERRLQFMEKEQIKLWKEAHPGEKIIDIDVPLSYGLHRIVKQSSDNSVELLWDPMKETGIYIKVNCISTEFTPKKHGGEKGVPFRIQVETYLSKSDDNFSDVGNAELLHAAFCQVRVFKLKGADRKHKQDRDKIMKRSALEQKRYKPSCECTILNTMPCDLILANYPQPTYYDQRSPSPNNDAIIPKTYNGTDSDPLNNIINSPSSVRSENSPGEDIPLSQDTNTERMSQWLQNNRFSAYLTTFSHFSGSDIWSLSRDDLIQICGVPDGIRLYNSLHSKIKCTPRLTVYVCLDTSTPCNAIYLQTLTAAEFILKVRQFLCSSKSSDNTQSNGDDNEESYLKLPIYIIGPGGIHVVITNELVANIQEKTIFTIVVERDKILLKDINRHD
ncbi:transcription factor CP2-like protein 1 isoform X2 [Ctenocephalides felis]|uniref:transcription factor CP2-like protein 1 isoform X2 n=1 Tax=Ctenocephalides felis TaxID=7515 RepID=UPI000E6E4B3B|nr:transcription factor CP2-like protein 1 isoform X2 [Ctenocephalides felis]